MTSSKLKLMNFWVEMLVCELGEVVFYSKATVIYDVIGTYYYLLYVDDEF